MSGKPKVVLTDYVWESLVVENEATAPSPVGAAKRRVGARLLAWQRAARPVR